MAAYYDTLVDQGLQGASLAKVARRLDVPPGLLIHYFGTNEQMTVELVATEDPLLRLHAILDRVPRQAAAQTLAAPGFLRVQESTPPLR